MLIGALIIGISLLGLAADGGYLFSQRRNLQNLADTAALAGASTIDEQEFRESDGRILQLDSGVARDAAEQVLVRSGVKPDVAVEIGVTGDQVTVRLRRNVKMRFLRITGYTEQDIGASATAQAAIGGT